jgi:plasmid stabilization system protein ParE
MAFEVIWNARSLRDLDRLEAFLWDKNPRAAGQAIVAIVAATRTLAEFPQAGRTADDLDLEHRELLVAFGRSGYVIFYRVADDYVEVLAVRHQFEAGY